jgi:uncharacterized membrane protein YfcA
MLKRLGYDSKFASGLPAIPVPPGAIVIGLLGLGFLTAEIALLYGEGAGDTIVALLAVLAASAVSSIAAFAFSALCGALLFHVLDSQVYAVQVMTVASIAIQSLSVIALWRSIEWRSLLVYLIGGLLGVPAGVWLLLNLHSGVYRVVIGVLLIAYGGYLLLRYRIWSIRAGPIAEVGAGFVGGITGGLAAFPGAAVTTRCSLKGWDNAHQRGVYQPFILLMQPVTLIAIWLMQPPTSLPAAQMNWETLIFVPAALLGTWFGLHIFKRLSDPRFELAVCGLLIVSGIGLVV